MDADTSASSETSAYIARCRCGCGGIVFAVVDNPEHADDTAKEVARCIRNGYAVERTVVSVVRTQPFGCQAPKPKMQDFWIADATAQKKIQEEVILPDGPEL